MRVLMWAAVVAGLSLGGCQKREERAAAEVAASGKPGVRGRFVGVGIYTPQQMWTQLARPATSQDPAAATLEDDEQVIVVIDSATGEIRQCGNLSGHCLALNPWSASSQGAPAALLKHARQLAEEAEAEAEAALKRR